MGTWLTENIATIIISVLLMAAIAAILVHMIRNRKKGETSCMWLFPLPHERQLPSEDMTQRETSVSAGASRCSQQKRRVMGIKPVTRHCQSI